MCTLLVLHQYHGRYPLIVAANRDENYDRRSAPPRQFGTNPLVISPRDLRSGGTWMGAATGGWFVGLTNQDDGVHAEGKISRGQVVDECLFNGNHSACARFLTALDPTAYNPFNLVFGRPGAMFLARYHGEPLELEVIEEGIHAFSNDCAGNKYRRKVNHAIALASSVEPDDDPDVVAAKLLKVLSDHSNSSPNPYQALCVHADADNWGTRSSSIVMFDADGSMIWYHGEGHPCKLRRLERRFDLLSLDLRELEEIVLQDEDIEVIGPTEKR